MTDELVLDFIIERHDFDRLVKWYCSDDALSRVVELVAPEADSLPVVYEQGSCRLGVEVLGSKKGIEILVRGRLRTELWRLGVRRMSPTVTVVICAECGYSAKLFYGWGMSASGEPSVCKKCRELVTARIERSMILDAAPCMCPECKKHVVPWCKSRVCPKCGGQVSERQTGCWD